MPLERSLQIASKGRSDMFWLKILGLIIGSLFVVIGLFIRKLDAPDPQLAMIHRRDADDLSASGDTELANRALMYADEAEIGRQAASLYRKPIILGMIIVVVLAAALFL